MRSPDLDCLFVHTPKADNHYLPFGDFFNITYMPMGLTAIARHLRDQGCRTEVIHLGVEWLENPEYNVAEDTADQRIRAIGLSLYWHYQTYDVIEVARALRAAHPDAYIFLGGLTAGYFADEILAECPHIDAVIRGHAEGSCALLVELLKSGGDLGHVPGMVHRVDGNTIMDNSHNPVTRLSVPTPSIDDLHFADLSVMRHPETYAKSFGFPLAYGREFSATENQSMLSMGRAFFPLFIGRGCPWMCTFCGGNRDTLRRVNGTSKLNWRSPDRVVDDIRQAMDFGYKTMALCFDPTPTKDTYYRTLFEKIRQARLDVDFYFECWGLPTLPFIEDFRKTFPSPESYLAVSPDTGNEAVRKRNKQPFYTNEELFTALDRFEEHEVTFDVFYTMALPGEVLATARDTQDQINTIAARYQRARRLMTWTVQLEPGSAQYERPEQFNMITDRHGFADFYRVHGGQRADTYSSLGFKINDYFGDARDAGGIQEFERHLQHLKCMEFCFLGRDPRFWNSPAQGRQHCFERRKLLAERRGTALPTRAIGEGFDYMNAIEEENKLRPQRARHQWT